jgi:predicted DNA-binding transcriptional regulator YafY
MTTATPHLHPARRRPLGRRPGAHTQAVRCLTLLRALEDLPVGWWVQILELAAIFGVSERTIHGDLDALQYAGEPLVRGRRGARLAPASERRGIGELPARQDRIDAVRAAAAAHTRTLELLAAEGSPARG